MYRFLRHDRGAAPLDFGGESGMTGPAPAAPSAVGPAPTLPVVPMIPRHSSSRLFLVATILGALVAATGLRAQFSESPYPVAPGRFLVEVDAFSLAVKEVDAFEYSLFGVGDVLLTAGITPALDLQVGAQLYLSQKVETTGFTDEETGMGNLYLRSKWKIYDDGTTAFALLPFVTIPTGSHEVAADAVEGGIILPWAANLPAGFRFVAQAEFVIQRNALDDGYDSAWGASGYVHRDLPFGFGVYGEAITRKTSGGDDFEGSLGGGVTLHTTIGSWDYAMYKGLSDGAADWTAVLRYSLPF
jgi:hypothetical protein